MPLDNITELKKRVPGGKYALARAVAERARQLQGGATPLTEVRAPNPLSVAIDEIVQGKITFSMDDSEEPPAAPAEAADDASAESTEPSI
jgi:DNA-directed RNA polymerase subunit K/omega